MIKESCTGPDDQTGAGFLDHRGRSGLVGGGRGRRGPPRLLRRGSPDRHRRPAQRRQVHPLQRPDQERRARGELPVRDDRAQRRRGRRCPTPRLGELAEIFGSAARSSRRRCRSSTSPASSAARREGAGPGQQVPRQHPRGRRDLPGHPGRSPTPTSCTSTARSRPADDIETINTELILADLQTLEKAIPRLEKEARNDKDRAPVARGRRGGAGGARRRADRVRGAGSTSSRCASCSC